MRNTFFNTIIVSYLVTLAGCSLGQLGDEPPTDAAFAGDAGTTADAGPLPATDSGTPPPADSGPPTVDAGTDSGPPPAPDAGPTWVDCGDRERVTALTVRVSSDTVAETSGNIGACAETWDPYWLGVDPWTGMGYAYGEPGRDIEREPLFSDEFGWQRFGFKCGYSGPWASDLPAGRTAESLGVTVIQHFPSGDVNVSSSTYTVAREDGVRLEVSLHRDCR